MAFDSTVSNPWGLRPVRYQGGAAYAGAHRIYRATQADHIAVGDPVKLFTASDSSGYPVAVLATAGAAAIGVCVGIMQFKPGQFAAALAANSGYTQKHFKDTTDTDIYLMVCDDPNVVYEIQEDGVTSSLVAADVGLNANFITAAPNETTGISQTALDSNTQNTTSTLNLKILGLSYRADGKNVISAAGAAGNYACWDVMINNHQLSPNAAGV